MQRLLALDASSQIEESLLEHGAGLLVHVLSHLVCELVGVLTGGRHPHSPRPVVVHVGQFVA